MKLDWRKGSLYAAAVGIEGCWLYAGLELFNRQLFSGQLDIVVIMLVFPLAFLFNSLLWRLRWHRFIRRGISWLAGAVLMLLLVKVQLFAVAPLFDNTWLLAVPRSLAGVIYSFEPPLFILLASGVLWWLGWRLAGRSADFASLVGEFQFGLFMLVIALLSASLLEKEMDYSVYLVVAFFIFSLLGISIAHALEGTGWLSGLYQGHWSGLLLVSISLVFLVGFIIAAVFTPDFLQLIVSAIKYVWGLLVKALLFLFSLLPEPEAGEIPSMPAPTSTSVEMDKLEIFHIPETLRRVMGAGWMVLFIGGILFAMWRVFSDILRWLHRRLSTPGAEYERIPGAFRADLLGFLRWLWRRLLGWRPPWLRRRAAPESPEVASVRKIYGQFLHWAAAGGYPRHLSQTPNEYGEELSDLLPESQADLGYLTSRYVAVRYGALSLAEPELKEFIQSWHGVKKNRLKRKRKD